MAACAMKVKGNDDVFGLVIRQLDFLLSTAIAYEQGDRMISDIGVMRFNGEIKAALFVEAGEYRELNLRGISNSLDSEAS